MNQRAYMMELQEILFSLPEDKRRQFMSTFIEREKNPLMGFGFNAYLGVWGADMFYLNKVGLGILKLLTGGGLGIWVLINIFLIGGMVRDQNIQRARELKASMQSLQPAA